MGQTLSRRAVATIAQQSLGRDEERLAPHALVVGRVLSGPGPAVPAMPADEDIGDRVDPRRVCPAALRAAPPRANRHPADHPAGLLWRERAFALRACPRELEVLLTHEHMFAW